MAMMQGVKKLPLIRYAGSAGRSLGKSAADGQQIQFHSLVFEPSFASHWLRNTTKVAFA